MKALIFDPVGGAAGDMILGSLIQLGCPTDYIREMLSMLELGGWELDITDRRINSIGAVGLRFTVPEEKSCRNFGQIHELIVGSALPEGIIQRALKVFDVIAGAEAQVHAVAKEKVHFHEVGAMDSILDIVGIAAAIEYLAPERIYSRRVPLGSGVTGSMHGMIPVPAPATIRILEGLPVEFREVGAELTTPTGAAVIRALSEGALPGDLVVGASGYGAGTREIENWPNLFRVILCETVGRQDVFMVETDVDDMLPEDWENVRQRLFDAGVLDVSLVSLIMKNGRPGCGLRVMTEKHLLDECLRLVLTYTTTIGVRYYPVQRALLDRWEDSVETPLGTVRAKFVRDPQGKLRCKPEYRDIAKLAEGQGSSMSEVRRIVGWALTQRLDNEKKD
ncbi:MAG: nickel pincer cofactor biosynthesis protein LarC [Thermodesulfobacteriota bacterium]|nr:nickel pincer cofactor biosynthesis protein LarC [Thermodesulfobacteriota bacterium]